MIQAVVTEFHLGTMKTQGNQWFSDEVLLSKVRLATGDRINSRNLEDDLAALNQNPFRRVSIAAAKSAIPGDTDLILNTQDRLPLRVYTGYDDYGTSVLGYDRGSVGFNWGDVFGLDQQLAYQLTPAAISSAAPAAPPSSPIRWNIWRRCPGMTISMSSAATIRCARAWGPIWVCWASPARPACAISCRCHRSISSAPKQTRTRSSVMTSRPATTTSASAASKCRTSPPRSTSFPSATVWCWTAISAKPRWDIPLSGAREIFPPRTRARCSRRRPIRPMPGPIMSMTRCG